MQLAPVVQVFVCSDPCKTGRVTSNLCNYRNVNTTEDVAAAGWPPCSALQELRLTGIGAITRNSAIQLAPFAKQLRVLHLQW
jgi:hypothetical protein